MIELSGLDCLHDVPQGLKDRVTIPIDRRFERPLPTKSLAEMRAQNTLAPDSDSDRGLLGLGNRKRYEMAKLAVPFLTRNAGLASRIDELLDTPGRQAAQTRHLRTRDAKPRHFEDCRIPKGELLPRPVCCRLVLPRGLSETVERRVLGQRGRIETDLLVHA